MAALRATSGTAVRAYALMLAVLVAFARPLEQIMLWFHGILLIGLVLACYLSLRTSTEIRLSVAGAWLVGLTLFAALNGMAHGFGVVPVFRDATPFLALFCGMLLMNLPADRVLPIVWLHVVVAALLMMLQVLIRYLVVPTASALDLYFYRADLPLYVSYMPLGAMLLWYRGNTGRVLAAGVVLAIILTFGRVDYAVLMLMIGIILMDTPLLRNPALRLLFIVIGLAGAVGGFLILGELGGALARLAVDSVDAGVGWRLIELQAFLTWWQDAGTLSRAIGDGFGAFVLLPGKLLDFAGNPTIPVLHFSPLTWILKVGVAGLLLLMVVLAALAFSPAAARVFGRPVVLLFLGVLVARGLVQHGLYEPWPLFLLGLMVGAMRTGFAATPPVVPLRADPAAVS
jgi:hypothetical protein